jgi:adenylyltransferase/sulfurtransferase
MTNDELKRYNRHIILPGMGTEGQQKLKDAVVLVVGCGGLGCPVLQYLVAAGVGNIGMIDPDMVSESNLQRQILYSIDDIGKPKVFVAKEWLVKLNPFVNITPYYTAFDVNNCREMVSDYSIVIDCTDNFATRYIINDSCIEQNKVMVYGSVFQFEGQASVFNYKEGPSYRSLYPEPPGANEVPKASEVGVLGVLPGIIGLIQATEVIKIITGLGKVLSGKLLVYDALGMSFQIFNVCK